MKILGIDTSCDDTAVAVTEGRRVLSNELFSQIEIHGEWGGVVPNLAKRAHEEHFDSVYASALTKAGVTMDEIDAIAVTYGPGLAIALGVGIKKAIELSKKYDKKLIAVNHMAGHVYSCFAQNADGQPDFPIEFPYVVVLVSGGHTEMHLMKDHHTFTRIGTTHDDAAGEALDKGARIILDEAVYPGGPVIEKMALEGNPDFIRFPRPMERSKTLDFSYSGLKTSLLYKVRSMTEEERIKHQNDLAASYQAAVFDSLLYKVKAAMKQYKVNKICVGGGVAVNKTLRKKFELLAESQGGYVLVPSDRFLNGDNGAMIGVAGYFQALNEDFVHDVDTLERNARAAL